MAGLKMTPREFYKIRRSAGMQRALAKLAAELADDANSRAGIADGYVSVSEVAPNPDVTVGKDTTRAHVWAKTGEAIRAERRNSPLMQIAAEGKRLGD